MKCAMTTTPLDIPLAVFQCRSCGHIVGDSASAVGRHLAFLLLAPPETPETPGTLGDMHTPREGADRLCTYRDILCSCGKTIGRRYIAVTEPMVRCVGKDALLCSALRAYRLGVAGRPALEGADRTELSGPDKKIAGEIAKLQEFCAFLHSRVEEGRRREGRKGGKERKERESRQQI